MNHTNESFIIILVKFTFFSSIPFLIAKDLITRLSSISTIVATRIFAKVGMQSYSITVFISGDKYSETGLSTVCRDRILGRFLLRSESKDSRINLNLDLSKVSVLLNNNLILNALELI